MRYGKTAQTIIYHFHYWILEMKQTSLSFLLRYIVYIGSKGSSKSQDTSDLKPLPPLKPISSVTSKKTIAGLPERKRDCPSPLQPLRLAKRPKTSSPLHSPSVSIDIENSLKSLTASPLPPVAPIEGTLKSLLCRIRGIGKCFVIGGLKDSNMLFSHNIFQKIICCLINHCC